MAYFLKYTMSFQDKHNDPAQRIQFRVDILADQPAAPDAVVILTPAETPLLLEYLNSDESKTSWIIGRKATISYVFTGAAGEPDVDVFFDVDERKHRVEVYKDNVLDGAYYIKPDAGQYPYAHTPYVNTLTAVDGLAFAKGTNVVARDSGSLIYHREPLNVFLPRISYQVIDPGTPINAMLSMRPNGLVAGHNMFSDVEVHTDMFFDFVDGAKSVYDSLEMFCKSFYARLFPAKGALWFIRSTDLYEGTDIVNIVTGVNVDAPDFYRSINPDTLPAVERDPVLGINPALKQASFKVDYRSINQLVNFDWSVFTPLVGFDDWFSGLGLNVSQATDSDGLENTYLARIGFGTTDIALTQFTTNTGQGPYNPGDILQISFKYRFWNTKKLRIKIELVGASTVYWLNNSGEWIETVGTSGWMEITRSGKKQDGNFKLNTNPIPSVIGVCDIWFYIENPTERSYHTPPEDGDIKDSDLLPDCADIYPVKIGAIGFNSLGRASKIINKALYSKVQPEIEFNFIDTGEPRLSNTLFLSGAAINGWTSTKAGIPTVDIERRMAQSNIDEYAKSVRTFEGTLYSNTIEFYNIFAIDGIADKKFMMLRDKYDTVNCKHEVLLEEVLPEKGAETYYTEKDLDEN